MTTLRRLVVIGVAIAVVCALAWWMLHGATDTVPAPVREPRNWHIVPRAATTTQLVVFTAAIVISAWLGRRLLRLKL